MNGSGRKSDDISMAMSTIVQWSNGAFLVCDLQEKSERECAMRAIHGEMATKHLPFVPAWP
jgi:hypothetical protein